MMARLDLQTVLFLFVFLKGIADGFIARGGYRQIPTTNSHDVVLSYLTSFRVRASLQTVDVTDGDDQIDERLSTISFFNDLRGVKAKVPLSALIGSYYVEEMLQDGVVTKKQLTDIAQGKRQLDFELFYEVCNTLNKLQDDFVASDAYDSVKIAEQDEAKKVFNELRGDKNTVSVTAVKSLYYFDQMIKDGVITSQQFSEMTSRKRQFDYDLFYATCSKLDSLIDASESKGVKEGVKEEEDVDEEAEERIEVNDTISTEGTATSPAEDLRGQREQDQLFIDIIDRSNERELEEKKEIQVVSIIRELFSKLHTEAGIVTIQSFKNLPVVENMLAENVIDTTTIDTLVSILDLKDSMDFDDFNQLVRLLDDSTGMGLVEVQHTYLI